MATLCKLLVFHCYCVVYFTIFLNVQLLYALLSIMPTSLVTDTKPLLTFFTCVCPMSPFCFCQAEVAAPGLVVGVSVDGVQVWCEGWCLRFFKLTAHCHHHWNILWCKLLLSLFNHHITLYPSVNDLFCLLEIYIYIKNNYSPSDLIPKPKC